ncbi:hypothetical protein MLD38_009791 [Melastoma candidum]|uniref:Uncharacterized protein n=1 Tax=Melastoma candidum TaxID=119954 RepID=A0ACB9S2D5_9MYRT|nr:hypothetical protein MLD38_009791 [Melastoma candidum]
MEATALLSLPTRPENPFLRLLSRPGKFPPLTPSRRFSVVRSAISRTKKEETVETIKTHLQDCSLIAAINYKRFTVKQFQELRRCLPESATLVVAKNTLVFKAVEGTPWEALKPGCSSAGRRFPPLSSLIGPSRGRRSLRIMTSPGQFSRGSFMDRER